MSGSMILRAVFALLLLLLLPFSAAAAPGEEVRVGLYENSPKVILSSEGAPGGIFVDVIEEIAKREGWRLRYVPGTWQQGLERLQRGEIDLMPDVALDAERDQIFAFHREPMLSSWSQVYARRGGDIRALPDLHGRRVAVLRGSIQEDQFTSMVSGFGVSVTMVRCAAFDEAFRAVADGRADAVVTNRYYGEQHAKRFGLIDTAVIFSPVKLYFAASRRADPALLQAIDRRLVELKADSMSPYYASLRRWTKHDAPPRVPAWLLWSAAMLAALMLSSLAWGITLRRSAARLRESAEHQERLLEELARAKDAAEAADRLKSAFLATMSHELRTPLNSIIGFTGIVLQRLPGPLNDEQSKQLGMVQGSARHLLALINDVLDISKIEAGELKVACEPFDLRASLEKVAGSMKPLAASKGLGLHLELAPEIGPCASDQRRVEQILINLLSNAIKFTERGDVTLAAETAAGSVRMSVRDTGMGIKQEDLQTLFRPFQQVDSEITRAHGGTGLGLAICRRLARLLGGDVQVQSEWGKGSTFTVTLPVSGEVAA